MSKLDTSTLKPGDVLVIQSSIFGVKWLIKLQAILSGGWKYRQAGHVVIVDHTDSENRVWGIEARADGIGWLDLSKFSGKWYVVNNEQPRTTEVDTRLVTIAREMLGKPYDYMSYLDIALQTLGISDKWTDFKGNDIPPHFICSALADYVYEKAGLPNPGSFEITRFTTPWQWFRFIDKKQWNA